MLVAKGKRKAMECQSFQQLGSAHNYALSQLFSTSMLKRLHDPLDEQNIERLIKDCNIYPIGETWDLIKGLEIAYTYLKQFYRCEYVYKNEIANQLLLHFHNDNSATLLKELSSDSSIADIVIVNGSTTAYEIKTELDSFDRLSNQLTSYQSIYDYLYIVTYPNAINKISTIINKDVGIIVFDHDGILKIEREAIKNTNSFNPSKAVLTLRQSELVAAYKEYVGPLPRLGTALIHSFCYHWYLTLDQADAHVIFAQALKSRKLSTLQFQLVRHCSPALTILFLGKVFSKKYCNATIDRLCIFG